MEQQVTVEVERLMDYLNGQKGAPVDTLQPLGVCIGSIIGSMLMGQQ